MVESQFSGSTALSRNAGPVMAVAGGLLTAVDVARYAVMGDGSDRAATSLELGFRVVNVAYFFAFVGLAVALVALYLRQADRTGRLGLVAFTAALLGTMTQAGNMWFDGFAAPWLAEVAPQVFTGPKTEILQLGGLLSYALFALGWVLVGVAVLRARTAPVVIGLAVVVAGVLGFNSGLAPYGVPIGLAVAALGGWMVHEDRAARRAAVSAA